MDSSPGPCAPSLLMVSTKRRSTRPDIESMKLTWPDRQGTDKAVCVVVACSAFALAGVLDPNQDQLMCWSRKRKLPRGVEDRVRGRTMGAGVPSRPRSSQTFQMWAVPIRATPSCQPKGDPIRLGSTQTSYPQRLLAEALLIFAELLLCEAACHPET